MVYKISYKTLTGAKPLRISLDIVGEFIRVYYRTTYLVLFCPEMVPFIFTMIPCIISGISKSEAVNLQQKAYVAVKSKTLWDVENIITYKNGQRKFQRLVTMNLKNIIFNAIIKVLSFFFYFFFLLIIT